MPIDPIRETLRRIDLYWQEHKKVPSHQLLADTLKISIDEVRELFEHPDFIRLLQKSYYWEAYQRSDTDLSTQQLLCLNVLANVYDKRSHTQKFRELKITPSQFNKWMQEPVFSRALNERVQQNFHDDGWKVFQSILDTASTGDTNAAKFYMELTGRYVPQTRNTNVNANISIKAVDLLVEVLMRHLGHLPNGAQLLEAIGQDFQSVLSGTPLSSAPPRALAASSDVLNEYVPLQRPQLQERTITIPDSARATNTEGFSPVDGRKRSEKVLDFIESLNTEFDVLDDF